MRSGLISAIDTRQMSDLTESDVAYEEELLRDPYQIKSWLRYISSKRDAPPTLRYGLYERALKIMPGRSVYSFLDAFHHVDEGRSSRGFLSCMFE